MIAEEEDDDVAGVLLVAFTALIGDELEIITVVVRFVVFVVVVVVVVVIVIGHWLCCFGLQFEAQTPTKLEQS